MYQLTIATALPLRAQNGGLFISRGQGVHPDRRIDSYELVFVRKGVLEIQEEDQPFRVQVGQALILWPERRHFGLSRYAPDLSFYWLHFHVEEDSGRSMEGLTLTQLTTVQRPDHLSQLFQMFLDDQESDQTYGHSADLLVMQMLQEVARPAMQTQHDAHKAGAVLANRAESYIATQFQRPLSTAKIAAALECSPDYLSRVYQQIYGRTVTEGIHRQRLNQAARLLRESDRYVDHIARMCGFAEIGYFRRLFKRHYATTPLTYRKLYAQVHINTL